MIKDLWLGICIGVETFVVLQKNFSNIFLGIRVNKGTLSKNLVILEIQTRVAHKSPLKAFSGEWLNSPKILQEHARREK